MVVGWAGPTLAQTGGLRQALSIDPLLLYIQHDVRLPGLALQRGPAAPWLKGIAHADDVTLIGHKPEELALLRGHLARYEWASGARINPEKTSIVDARFEGDGLAVTTLEEGLGAMVRDPDQLVPTAIIHADMADGSLGVPDPALLFTSRFIGANLIRKPGNAVNWSFCQATWGDGGWILSWAGGEHGGIPRRTPQAMAGLPDHHCELTAQAVTYQITGAMVRQVQDEQPAKVAV
uniref:Uncharacterized protein n=1 Tax=Sphaerodactylus townsendi TaxID=933632 RepID=A0ACB8F7Y9_9SAUR